jgi:hypothetical protein
VFVSEDRGDKAGDGVGVGRQLSKGPHHWSDHTALLSVLVEFFPLFGYSFCCLDRAPAEGAGKNTETVVKDTKMISKAPKNHSSYLIYNSLLQNGYLGST